MKILGRVMILVALATVFLFAQEGSAWEVKSRWTCCGKNPRQRVHVLCKDGRMPTYVLVNNRWCKKYKGRADGDGACYDTLEAAAKAWCKE